MSVNFTMISTPSELSDLMTRLSETSVISIDTEFARFNTYYPIVGLIQIYDGQQCFIIDPLEVTDLEPLAALLANEDVIKVFHACSEDIEVFQHGLGVIPSPIFDTQTAAAILGTGFSLSYQKLVLEYLDIEISKDETRSDWLQRPLTDSQLDYAALDVIHLLEVYEKQVALLESAQRHDWVIEECGSLGSGLATTVEPTEYFLKVRGAGKLDRQSLGILQALCAWRENLARELDVPRNRVVDEKSLLVLSNRRPTTKEECQRVSELTPKQVRKYSAEIIDVIALAQAKPADLTQAYNGLQKVPIDKKNLKIMRETVDNVAQSYGVSPEMLAKKRHLEFILRSALESNGVFQLPSDLQGWRKKVIGDELLSAAAKLAGGV
jgi:ribonuclease D